MDVSVLMPVKNCESYIREAIWSVFHSYSNLVEVIVVDDSSSDNTVEVVRAIKDDRVIIINNSAAGISNGLNDGLQVAKGEFITRCDADDTLPAGRLTEQVAFLNNNPEYDAVAGGFSPMDDRGNALRLLVSDYGEITDELRRGYTRTTLCAFLIRRSAIDKVGLFRTFFRSGEDIDFQLRLGEAGRVFYEGVSRYNYRLIDGSITHLDGIKQNRYYQGKAIEFQRQRIARGLDDLDLGLIPPPYTGQRGTFNGANVHSQGLLLGLAWEQWRNDGRIKALKTWYKAMRKRPGTLAIWKSLGAMLLRQRV